MQTRAKTVFGTTTAFGVIAAAALMAPISAAAAAAPTFDIVPLRTAFGPVQLTGTAEAGDTVSLYEYAYVWGYDWDQSRLSGHPSADYDAGIGYVTTKADANGRWSITRNLDSGHVFMVGTDDGYSQIRKAALRVKADLNVTVNGTTVNFSVSADPSQPGLPVEIQRYSNGSWTRVASGATSEGSATFSGSAENQPAGTSYYRAFLEDDEDKDWADKSNYIVANYSENQPATVGSGGSNGVPPSNPTPTPEYDTGTVTPSTPPSSKPPTSPPSSKPPTSPPTSKPPTTPPTSKPPTTPPAGPAAGSVQFTRVQYNAPGKDTKKNKSVNGEYFKLTNKTKKTINLKGWTVRDRAGNLYRFTSTYYLRAGKSVTVHTGKGSNKSSVRYWGKAKHVWNNGGDTATLRTDTSKTIDTCRWTKAGKGWTAC